MLPRSRGAEKLDSAGAGLSGPAMLNAALALRDAARDASLVDHSLRQQIRMPPQEPPRSLDNPRQVRLFHGQRQIDHAALGNKVAVVDHLELEQPAHRRIDGHHLAEKQKQPNQPKREKNTPDAGRLEGNSESLA